MTDKVEDVDLKKNVPGFFSKRWILAYIGCVSFIFVYAVRSDINVAIVCMVKTNNSISDEINITDTACQPNSNTSTGYERAEFDWSKTHQSGLLSAFYYGYIFAQIPGGWLAGRFGGKYVLGIGWTLGAINTLFTPLAARTSIYILYALRVSLGIMTGVSYPAMQTLWGRWAPPLERSKLLSLTFSGSFIGNIVTFAISGFLCAEGFDNGWGSIFYVVGIADVLWLMVWFLMVSDSPDKHPSISEAERNYITKSIGGDRSPRVTSTPWRKIATCKALYVIIVCHVCFNWMIYLINAEVPTFMKKVLKFDVKSNGLLSASPYIAMAFTTITGGQLADYILTNHLSVKVTRRLFQSVSLLGASACLVGTGYVTCSNRYLGVILLCFALGFMGLSNAGYMVNIIEFAPKYAGILFGISNMIATVPGMTAPLVVGALTPHDSHEEWQLVFYICAGTGVLGAVVFATMSEYDVKEWGRDPEDSKGDVIEVKEDMTKQKTYLDNDGEINRGYVEEVSKL